MATFPQAKPKEVVDHWYSEVKDHKFGEEPKGTALKSGELVHTLFTRRQSELVS